MENDKTLARVYKMTFSSVYPLYVKKVERKNRTAQELDAVIMWLTGYDAIGLQEQIDAQVTFLDFFDQAPIFNPNHILITGSVCGVKVEEVGDPLLKKMRYLDKLVDELAKGRPLEKIMRQP